MNYKIYVPNIIKYSPLLIFLLLILQGCAGTHTYTNTVLAGETAVVGAGWKHHFAHDNVTVTFTPEVGAPIIYLPGDSAIRGIINLYPDPLSSLVISEQVQRDITSSSLQYATLMKSYTDGGNEWWQTTVYLDTPPGLPVGETTITITTPEGETATSIVNVVGAGGSPDSFIGEGSGSLNRVMFQSMERIDHYVVEFTGTTIPAAIQVDLSSTLLLDTAIKGKRGDISTLNWSDDGSGNYRVIIMPASQGSVSRISDFSFYVPIASGLAGVTTLAFNGPVQAFDDTGSPITDIDANISLVKGVAGLYE